MESDGSHRKSSDNPGPLSPRTALSPQRGCFATLRCLLVPASRREQVARLRATSPSIEFLGMRLPGGRELGRKHSENDVVFVSTSTGDRVQKPKKGPQFLAYPPSLRPNGRARPAAQGISAGWRNRTKPDAARQQVLHVKRQPRALKDFKKTMIPSGVPELGTRQP